MVGASIENKVRFWLKGLVQVRLTVHPVENALDFLGVLANVIVDPVIILSACLAGHNGGERTKVTAMHTSEILVYLGGLREILLHGEGQAVLR
jgi:hypothetical protein